MSSGKTDICKRCGHDNSGHSNQQCENCKGFLAGRKSAALAEDGKPINKKKSAQEKWQAARKEIAKAVSKDDMKQALLIMLDFAESAQDARMMIKEFAPYTTAKKKSVDPDSNVQDNRLEIVFTQ